MILAGAICLGLVVGMLLAQRLPARGPWSWRAPVAAAVALAALGGVVAWSAGLGAAIGAVVALALASIVRTVVDRSLLESSRHQEGRT